MKLKPCPFCGNDHGVSLVMEEEGSRARCRVCGSRGPASNAKNTEDRIADAVMKWNLRPGVIEIKNLNKEKEHGND